MTKAVGHLAWVLVAGGYTVTAAIHKENISSQRLAQRTGIFRLLLRSQQQQQQGQGEGQGEVGEGSQREDAVAAVGDGRRANEVQALPVESDNHNVYIALPKKA